MACEFSLKTLVIAVQKDFRQGFSQGVNQLGKLMVRDIQSRAKEVLQPEAAYFLTPIEVRINPLTGKQDLYWQNYKRSVDESMRRNIAWLKVQGAGEERVNQAKVERKSWQAIRDMGLNLTEGEGVQFMALKTTNPVDGVALQQLSKKDGQLILESQLLPFNQIDQIERFRELVGADGEEVVLERSSDGVDPAVGWVVQGKAIDFKRNLPPLINEIFPVRWPKLLSINIARPIEAVSGFWFASAAPEIIAETTRIVPEVLLSEAPKLAAEPVRLGKLSPTGFKPIQAEVKISPKTVKKSPVVIVPTRTDLVGVEVKNKIETVFQAEDKNEGKVTEKFEQVLKPIVPVRTVPVGSDPEVSEVIMPAKANPVVVAVKQTDEALEIVELPAVKATERKQIPIYPVQFPKLQPLTGIPEWVWQPQAASIEEAMDWQWFLVTIFYAVLNTKAERLMLKADTNWFGPGEG